MSNQRLQKSVFLLLQPQGLVTICSPHEYSKMSNYHTTLFQNSFVLVSWPHFLRVLRGKNRNKPLCSNKHVALGRKNKVRYLYFHLILYITWGRFCFGPIWPATYKIPVYMPTVQLYLTCKINKKPHLHILTLMNVNLSVWLV